MTERRAVSSHHARFLTNEFVLTLTSDIEDLESAVWKVEDLVEPGQDVVWRMKSLRLGCNLPMKLRLKRA